MICFETALDGLREGKVNTRNICDLQSAIVELDAIIEENANQLSVVKEAETLQLRYKVISDYCYYVDSYSLFNLETI